MSLDPDALLTGAQAAAAVGVSRQLVNYWRASGRLPYVLGRDGRPRYRLADVWAAEKAARNTPRSSRRLMFAEVA